MAFRHARSARQEERAANYRHCVELARPQARRGAFESQVAPPEPAKIEIIEPDTFPPPRPEQTAEPLDEPEPLEEIVWRTSARGNPWTRIGRAHIVIFPSRDAEGGWCLRLQYDDRAGRFLKHTWTSAEEAQHWVEANAHTVTR